MQGLRILREGLKEVLRGLKSSPPNYRVEEKRKGDNSLYWQKQYREKK